MRVVCCAAAYAVPSTSLWKLKSRNEDARGSDTEHGRCWRCHERPMYCRSLSMA